MLWLWARDLISSSFNQQGISFNDVVGWKKIKGKSQVALDSVTGSCEIIEWFDKNAHEFDIEVAITALRFHIVPGKELARVQQLFTSNKSLPLCSVTPPIIFCSTDHHSFTRGN